MLYIKDMNLSCLKKIPKHVFHKLRSDTNVWNLENNNHNRNIDFSTKRLVRFMFQSLWKKQRIQEYIWRSERM